MQCAMNLQKIFLVKIQLLQAQQQTTKERIGLRFRLVTILDTRLVMTADFC